MSANNKQVDTQGRKVEGPAFTPKVRTTKIWGNYPRKSDFQTTKDTQPTAPGAKQTTKTHPDLDEADHKAARMLLEMRYSLPDSQSTVSAPNSSPPNADLDKADYEAAKILFEMRHALPDSDSTVSAPKLVRHSDSTITAPISSPPSSLHGNITVEDYREWEASGIEKFSEYLACKDAALATSKLI